jgi:hypothetical protein
MSTELKEEALEHTVENPLCKRPWTCLKIDYRINEIHVNWFIPHLYLLTLLISFSYDSI